MALWATSGNERQEDLSRLICLIYRGDLRKLMAILALQKRLIDFTNHMMALLGMTYRRKCHGSVMLPNLRREFKYSTVSFLLSGWIFQTLQRPTDTQSFKILLFDNSEAKVPSSNKSSFWEQYNFMVYQKKFKETAEFIVFFLLKTLQIKYKSALLCASVILVDNTGEFWKIKWQQASIVAVHEIASWHC